MSALTILRRPQSQATVPHAARHLAPVAGMTVVLATLSFVVPWRLTEPWWVDTAVVVALLAAGAAAIVDVSSRRIPDRVVLATLLPTAAASAVGIVVGRPGVTAVGVVCGIAGFAVPILIVHLIAPTAMGFGDVKLAGALGAAIGLVDWRLTPAALCLASGLTVVVAIVFRRSALPFAPGLVAGSAIVLLLPILEGSPSWP